jgi:PKD repeat protein
MATALSLTLALSGCGLDDVEIPEIDGPAERAISVALSISPDVIAADGFSTALVTVTLRNAQGRGIAGTDIFLFVSDEDGRAADIGNFRGSNGPGTGVTIRTNSAGVAQVVYEAPVRTDATANQTILIQARPVGGDANGETYRTVRLELRSAEPRLFPQNPDNNAPRCNFVVEAPSGLRRNVAVLFQSTSDDSDGTIVRYEWFFGDGSGTEYAPDLAHVFRNAGTFTVTHRVTDDDGGQMACATPLTILP